MSTSQSITIRLTDANDNAPVVSEDEAFVSCRNDLPAGTTFATFTATDEDSEDFGVDGIRWEGEAEEE